MCSYNAYTHTPTQQWIEVEEEEAEEKNICIILISVSGLCNLPPVFTEDMNNLALSEATPVGWIVYTLEGYDPEGGEITFGLVGSDNFMVNPKTGEVKVVKALDREVRKPIYSDHIHIVLGPPNILHYYLYYTTLYKLHT